MTMKLTRVIFSTILLIFALTGIFIIDPSPVSAATYYVSKSGSDVTGDGSSGNPWLTVQHAVDNTPAGNTISIGNGGYNEQVTIGKSLTLTGSSDTGIYSASSPVIDITAGTVELQNMALFIPGASGTVIHVASASLTVYNNDIFNGSIGIDADGCTSLTVNHNLIHDTSFGIRFNTGIITITNNNIFDCAGRGIFNAYGDASGTITGNEIHSFKTGMDTGIMLGGTGSSFIVNDNVIYGCITRALASYCPVTITQNAFYMNTTGVEIFGAAATAHCNAFCGNTTAGLILNSDGTFDFTNNYWSANSGPNIDNSGPGTGQAIITNGHTTLTTSPWAVFNLIASPTSLEADGRSTSNITLDCTRNSAGQNMGCTVPDRMTINFTTSLGSLTAAASATSSGRAATTLVSGTTRGTAYVKCYFATVPTLMLSIVPVTFTNPVDFINTRAPGGSSMPSVGITQSPVQLPNTKVSSARLSSSTGTTGSPITVTADVANTGAANGTEVIKVYLNDELAASQGVNVAGGSSTAVTLTVTPAKAGEYTVYVNNVPAGTLKVTDVNDNDLAFVIAFAAFAVLIAALLGVYLHKRRTTA